MTRERNGVYVWVTWLSKLMAGETTCQWSSWFKAHHTEYAKLPSNFQLAGWTVEHTQLLDELSKEREALGETVYREGVNDFRARKPASGLTLAGKPDLIAVNPETGLCTVYDTKTGTARQSDIIQVSLYMMFVPYAMPLFKGKKFDGCVVYKTARSDVPHEMLSDTFKANVKYFLNILESPTPPPKVPTHNGCAWCDLTTEDCPERVDGEDDVVTEPGQDFPL